MDESLLNSHIMDKKFNCPVKKYVSATEAKKINKLYPFCRNSVLSVLLFGLVAFNLLFLLRGLMVNPNGLASSKLCQHQQMVNETHWRNSISDVVHVTFFAKYAYKNMKIVRGVDKTIGSILQNSHSRLHFHILLDAPSEVRIARGLKKLSKRYGRKINVTYYNVEEMAKRYQNSIGIIKQYFFSKDVGRYNDDIFFMSQIFHHAFPKTLQKVIFLDLDLKFLIDIKELQNEFLKFQPNNVIGIAPDLQPQYRMDFAKYRLHHPKTIVGSARPGRQGFNTGVTLFDLQKMRQSNLYNSLMNSTLIERLCKKYDFHGYLGHQDFFTLTGIEYPELYYNLHCSWNRQLDTGWRNIVGPKIFDPYHFCDGEVKILHGNGNANIPDESNFL